MLDPEWLDANVPEKLLHGDFLRLQDRVARKGGSPFPGLRWVVEMKLVSHYGASYATEVRKDVRKLVATTRAARDPRWSPPKEAPRCVSLVFVQVPPKPGAARKNLEQIAQEVQRTPEDVLSVLVHASLPTEREESKFSPKPLVPATHASGPAWKREVVPVAKSLAIANGGLEEWLG